MRYLNLIVVFLWMSATAAESYPIGPSYRIISDSIDASLQLNESAFEIRAGRFEGITLIYSIDEKEGTVRLNKASMFSVKTTPGKHKLAFYLDEFYTEIETDSILISPKHKITLQLNFERVDRPVLMKKPVIYLYPETEMNVRVSVNTQGELTFMYPAYNEGWNVKAHPNGDITSNGSSFNYLFWEGEIPINNEQMDLHLGSVVEKNQLLGFIEDVLGKYGLTTQEQEDFITFWMPQMIRHKFIYLHFEFDQECDKYAELIIEPIPKNAHRIYMFWSPVSNLNENHYLCPQKFETINRLGFTVLEWGGAEIASPFKVNM